MGEKNAFLPLVIFSDLWKNVGWGSIVYLAAIAGVDKGIIRSGGNRWRGTLEMYLAHHNP